MKKPKTSRAIKRYIDEAQGFLDDSYDLLSGEQLNEGAASQMSGNLIIFDPNDKKWTKHDEQYAYSWIRRKLGSKIKDAPVRAIFLSPDKATKVAIYDVPLGTTNDCLISRWSEINKKSWYYLATEDMYGIMLSKWTVRYSKDSG